MGWLNKLINPVGTILGHSDTSLGSQLVIPGGVSGGGATVESVTKHAGNFIGKEGLMPIREGQWLGNVITGKTSLNHAFGEHNELHANATREINSNNVFAKNPDATAALIFSAIAGGAAAGGGGTAADGGAAGGAALDAGSLTAEDLALTAGEGGATAATAGGTGAAESGVGAAGSSFYKDIAKQIAPTVVSSLLKPKSQTGISGTSAPTVQAPLAMPTINNTAIAAEKKKSIIQQMANRGRMSTILTGNNDLLGG